MGVDGEHAAALAYSLKAEKKEFDSFDLSHAYTLGLYILAYTKKRNNLIICVNVFVAPMLLERGVRVMQDVLSKILKDAA